MAPSGAIDNLTKTKLMKKQRCPLAVREAYLIILNPTLALIERSSP